MQRRIALLVAATTSAIVFAFVIPLGLLVRGLAEDRARAAGDEEARNVAILVSSLREDPGLRDVVAALDERSPARTSVVLADGTVFGTGDVDPADADLARAREGRAFSRSVEDGLRIVVPVLTPAGTDVVVTEVSDDQLHAGVRTAWLILAGLGAVLIGLASAAAASAARRISTPVTAVAAVADRLREGDLDARAEATGPAETRALAQALNRLGGRIRELLIAERGAAGDLAHRLRTPVTALRIDVDRVEDEDLAENLRQHVSTLQRTVDAIVKDARRPVQHTIAGRGDLGGVVAERVRFWSALAEDQERRLEAHLADGPLVVPVDEDDLRDVVDVLVDNVFAHTDEGVGLAVTLVEHGQEAVLLVADQGRWLGRRPEEPGRTGLGLQIARRIVTGAGGTLDVTHDESGTTVEVRLPTEGTRRA